MRPPLSGALNLRYEQRSRLKRRLFNCAPGMARSALTGAIPEGGASQDDLGVKVPYGP